MVVVTQEKTSNRAVVRARGRALGWVSLGLGAAQVFAPGAVRRLSGVDDSDTSRVVVPLVGARELVHAAGLLGSKRTGAWVWTRVVGDAIDLTGLAVAMAHRAGGRRKRVAAALGAVAAIAAVDLATALRARKPLSR